MSRPPSGLTQMRLLLGLAARRWVNRLFAGVAAANMSRKAARSGGPAPGTRPPTPRRKVGTGLILVFVTIISVHMVAFMTSQFLGVVSLEWALHSATVLRLDALEKEAADGRRFAFEKADGVIRSDPAILALPLRRQAPASNELTRRWIEHGSATLNPGVYAGTLITSAYPVIHERMLTFAGMVFLIGLFWIASSNLNVDFGKVEWSALWLTSLPIPPKVLFASLIVEYALINPIFWLSALPFLTLCAVAAGHGWDSPVIALGACAPVAAALAAIRLVIETGGRMHLNHARRKNLQIACTLISMVLTLVLFVIMMAPSTPWVTSLAEAVPWADLPTAWPVRATLSPDGAALPWLAGGGAIALILAAAGTQYCAWSVRAGFMTDSGTLQGDRRKRMTGWLPLSLPAKELLLLRRDRAFLSQVLGMPIFIIALQFVLNPDLPDVIAGSFRHACTLAFVFGGYLLMSSATTVVSAEGAALWLTTSSPHSLGRLLLRKVMLWTALALFYALAAVALAVALTPWPGMSGLSDAVMVVVGVPILAIIAAGLGAAGSDPLAVDPRQRIDQGAMASLMMIMSMYAQAIYTTDGHIRLLWIMLTGVLAYALWQRLEERLPWLLDPIDRPPRRLGLSDGALAAMAFLVIQSILGLTLSIGKWLSPSLVTLFAFSAAGILVALGSLWMLWRSGIAGILLATGLLPIEGWRRALPLNVAWGVAGGVAAALFGAVYLAVLRHFPLLAPNSNFSELPLGVLLGLTVVAAPPAEEFIFRGLLFAGLRTTIPVAWAVVASAAIFALIHPTVAVIPVFVVGCITAIAYQRTGWLLAPMLVHGIYNGATVLI